MSNARWRQFCNPTATLATWESNQCPIHMLCVPTSSTRSLSGICDCEFTLELYETDRAGGCAVGIWAQLFFSYWVIMGVVMSLMGIWMIYLLSKTAALKVFKQDSLGVSAVCTTISAVLFALSRFYRALYSITFTSDGLRQVSAAIFALEAAFGIMLFCAALSFGISLLNLTLTTVDHPQERVSYFWPSISCISFSFVCCTSALLLVVSGISIPYIVPALVFTITWIAVHRKFILLRKGWAPPGLYASIQQKTQVVMEHVSIASTEFMRALVAFTLCCVFNATCYYFGRIFKSKLIMAHMNAIAVALQFTMIVWGHWVMLQAFTNLYHVRSQRQVFVQAIASLGDSDGDSDEDSDGDDRFVSSKADMNDLHFTI
jgi:hypothetical protein